MYRLCCVVLLRGGDSSLAAVDVASFSAIDLQRSPSWQCSDHHRCLLSLALACFAPHHAHSVALAACGVDADHGGTGALCERCGRRIAVAWCCCAVARRAGHLAHGVDGAHIPVVSALCSGHGDSRCGRRLPKEENCSQSHANPQQTSVLHSPGPFPRHHPLPLAAPFHPHSRAVCALGRARPRPPCRRRSPHRRLCTRASSPSSAAATRSPQHITALPSAPPPSPPSRPVAADDARRSSVVCSFPISRRLSQFALCFMMTMRRPLSGRPCAA